MLTRELLLSLATRFYLGEYSDFNFYIEQRGAGTYVVMVTKPGGYDLRLAIDGKIWPAYNMYKPRVIFNSLDEVIEVWNKKGDKIVIGI